MGMTSFNQALWTVAEGRDWAAERAVALPYAGSLKPEHRWIARSALQKAVRRGFRSDALRIAALLHDLDPTYTWRAVLTIALEDVGFGAPDCITWATAARFKAFRSQIDEQALLSALVSEMCLALKTRSACELSWVTDAVRARIFASLAASPPMI